MPFVEPFVDSGGPAPINPWPPVVLSAVPTRVPARPAWIDLCGVQLTRTTLDDFLLLLGERFRDRTIAPIAVGSVNLDHLHHFGRRRGRPVPLPTVASGAHWLLLADGAPISRQASRRSGQSWPRLPGADLLAPALDVAQAAGARVGFLGGTEQSVEALREQLAARWPDLRIAGFWTPPRAELDDHPRAADLARSIGRTGVDLLVVGLGKPLQERWIDEHGARTGARVMMAFGGAADFLGGTTRRAPRWMRAGGLEWLFRLATEPRRLSRRYLVEGPPALARLLADHPGQPR